MFKYTDQMLNTIDLPGTPVRVISIVPSQSELLWYLGLRGELIGITKFCFHPAEMFNSVERIGGTKSLDLDKIRRLKPDLIIGNREENDKSQVEILQKEFNVWMSDIYDFDDALAMINRIGEIFQKQDVASDLSARIGRSLENTRDIFNGEKVSYFIWKNPYMLVAANTFIHQVLLHLGLKNAASHLNRYPEITLEELKLLGPDLCFLSSEPFPFKQQHVEELQTQFSHSKIMIVDGEMFSWYGSRLLYLEAYALVLRNKINGR